MGRSHSEQAPSSFIFMLGLIPHIWGLFGNLFTPILFWGEGVAGCSHSSWTRLTQSSASLTAGTAGLPEVKDIFLLLCFSVSSADLSLGGSMNFGLDVL